MLDVALAICAVGILTSFGSFLHMALNMGRSFSDRPRDFDNTFKSHIRGVLGMAVGSVILAVGILVGMMAGLFSLMSVKVG